ncbi:ROK family protein [Candidatus Woesearchaeota archaeon]|nr:ROK family protein [Candidatus Woesearchaeota archaeon]
MPYRIGLDIGGTKISGVLFNSSMEPLETVILPTMASSNAASTLTNVKAAVEKLSKGMRVSGVGISIAGRVDRNGRVTFNPNIKSLEGLNLRKRLGKLLKLPVKIENDGLCFAYGEYRLGAGRGCEDMVGIVVGTGIGGGLIISGRPYKGMGSAGEIGHMIIDPSGPRCGCGNNGDFESWCSGRNITRRYIEAGGKIPEPEPKKIFSSAEKIAREISRETIEKFGIGLANVQRAYDPEMIVMGGGLSNLHIYEHLEKEAEKHGTRIRIKKRKLEYPGESGACLLP